MKAAHLRLDRCGINKDYSGMFLASMIGLKYQKLLSLLFLI